jgi:hypothetical protein
MITIKTIVIFFILKVWSILELYRVCLEYLFTNLAAFICKIFHKRQLRRSHQQAQLHLPYHGNEGSQALGASMMLVKVKAEVQDLKAQSDQLALQHRLIFLVYHLLFFFEDI